ncbi:hypothetical protein F4703DRAFT_1911557 [Phycomyces blakesleeanus]
MYISVLKLSPIQISFDKQSSMFNELPNEVISAIGSFLSQEDQTTCLKICKAWTPVFQLLLWRKLFIDSDFIKFMYNASSPDNIYKNNGHKFTVNMVDWSLWKSLVHVEICLDTSMIIFGPKATFKYMSSITCLVNLNMVSYEHVTSGIYITWQDIEVLHQSFPRLENLKFDYNIMNIPPSDIGTVKNTTPATTVKKVRCKNINVRLDFKWIIYYGLKYPNLETLSFKMVNPILNSQHHIQVDFKNIITLYPNFSHDLKSLETFYGANGTRQPLAMFNFLNKSKAPIKKLSIHAQYFLEHPRLIKANISLMNLFSLTLNNLEVSLFDSGHSPEIFALRIIHHPFLVSLEIYLPKFGFEMDHILDQYPLLQSFKVHGSDIRLSPNTPPTLPTHGLRDLLIRCKQLDVKTMSYISFRCRLLGCLSLNAHSLNKSQLTGNSYLFDMSLTQLNLLVVNSIELMAGPCHLFAIEQAENITQSDGINTSVGILPQASCTQKTRTKCYRPNKLQHLHTPEDFNIFELNRLEIKYLQGFYPDFGPTYFDQKGVSDVEKEQWHTISDSLRKSIGGGYIVFRFKSVKNCFFQGYII